MFPERPSHSDRYLPNEAVVATVPTSKGCGSDRLCEVVDFGRATINALVLARAGRLGLQGIVTIRS
jgi:hypothetical protein